MDACVPQLISGGPGEAFRLVSLCGSVKPSFSGTEDFHDTLMDMLRQRGAGVSPVDPGGWGLGHVPQLLRSIAAARPDVILLQYPTDAFGTRLGPHAFGALHRGAPLVVTLHEFIAAHPLRRASLAVLLARANAVITTAETERRGLLSWYPWLRRRTCVIPIGSNIQGKPWRPADPPRVVYFGQIRPEKGLEEFFACRDAVAADFPQVEFVIAGSCLPRFAPYQQTIESAATQRGICLVKEMPAEQVSDFLSSATVALLPFPSGASFRRGTLLAAAACGVPIVTLTGPDTPPEMVRLLEPATCHEGLVAQLAACLSGKAALETGHRRSCALAAMVSWHSIADRYLDILDRVRSGAALPVDAFAPTPVQAQAS